MAKILALLKRLLIFAKKWIIPLVSEKEPILSPRIGAKIAENCDHNIDPCLCFFHVGKHPATKSLPKWFCNIRFSFFQPLYQMSSIDAIEEKKRFHPLLEWHHGDKSRNSGRWSTSSSLDPLPGTTWSERLGRNRRAPHHGSRVEEGELLLTIEILDLFAVN
jgi:hypothetical protein